jgi:hypothetical protein
VTSIQDEFVIVIPLSLRILANHRFFDIIVKIQQKSATRAKSLFHDKAVDKYPFFVDRLKVLICS